LDTGSSITPAAFKMLQHHKQPIPFLNEQKSFTLKNAINASVVVVNMYSGRWIGYSIFHSAMFYRRALYVRQAQDLSTS
jgi:hypothetical protein